MYVQNEILSLKVASSLHLFYCAIMQDFELSVYSPKKSSTSKTVPCNNSLCAQRDQCTKAFGNCPYVVSYVSAETSTTGILIEDLLHLKTEYKHSEPIQAYITFGSVYTNAKLDLVRHPITGQLCYVICSYLVMSSPCLPPHLCSCGQVQSGSFLDVAAPNGLFGLGMEQISVPSILSREGLMANSFSMCFSDDGVGRINFGDKGSPEQEETPFNLNQLQ